MNIWYLLLLPLSRALVWKEPSAASSEKNQNSRNERNDGFSIKNLTMTEKRVKRAAVSDPKKKWPMVNGYVALYYTLDSYSESERYLIQKALKLVEVSTCIRFVENNVANDRVKIKKLNDGCWSKVGRQGGIQELSLRTGCVNQRSIIHEFLHAVGFVHTQTRPDRDQFVRVITDNINSGNMRNFEKYENSTVKVYTRYDYGSIMHYPPSGFSINGQPTIITKDPMFQRTIGSKWPSFLDIYSINEHYGCLKKCEKANNTCLNGGYPDPRFCNQCLCPLGFGGPKCGAFPAGCGQILASNSSLQTTTYTVPPADPTSYTFCTHWFKAPAGKRVEVKILYISWNNCFESCEQNGVEFKISDDPRETGPRICCEAESRPFVSRTNVFRIISYTSSAPTQFRISFRSV